MLPLLNQTLSLEKLLSKFVDIMYISQDEMEWMCDYILSNNPVKGPVADDSEIYESLVYLRDLAQENDYKSIDDLVGYFETQEANLNKLVEPLLSDKGNDLSGLAICRVFNDSFKTDAIKRMTSCAFMSSSSLHSNIVQNLYETINNDTCIANVENAYKEINLTRHCLKSINFLRDRSLRTRILPNSDHYYFKHYFQSFSHPTKRYNKIISILKKIKGWFSNLEIGKKQRRKIKSLYTEIYDSIHTEQPIKNVKFKTMLSRMMLMSKLNNPEFRKYFKSFNTEKAIEENYSDVVQSDFIAKKLYYQHLSKKKWSILKSPAGYSWITSDNPGFSIDINPLFEGTDQIRADPYWMDIDAETMIYFPLSKEYCLRLQPEPDSSCIRNSYENQVISFEVSSEKELKAVNKLVFSAKPNVIISEDKGIQQFQCH